MVFPLPANRMKAPVWKLACRRYGREIMKAIFVTGGKQYCVSEGDVVYVEKLDAEVGKEVTFDEVLMAGEVFGNPTVKNASVVGVVEKQGKQKKITVFKYKPKKKYRKKQGHRQPYTKVTIKSINVK